ncbi:hypothetical protein N7539_003174 [Penicillium diatomitis]|uniref:Methyltransferase domain-containing protein n=1 Tax=Penicillium diatomitis TaxID=2819901 RepID=A0A9X0BZW3_9EURO|nr:uncharacterized protein N7539_003174 [Penicillium diatomitis]KAJ5491607.1 hypothetical protein N7539_003174 [Penicillium diatomitis]
MCESRARGMPLQYILGDQPFGELEILCRRGVLIPRADTEAYTYQAAKLVRQRLLQNQSQHQSQEQTPDPCTPQPHAAKNILQHDSSASSSPPPNSTSLFSPFHPKPIRILDLCTGTGCIALLLHALLKTPKPPHPQSPALQILGIDLSPTAVRLARRNLDHNVHVTRGVDACAKSEVHFRRGDVLKTQRSSVGEKHEDEDAVGEVDVPSVEQLLSYFDPEGEEIHRARNSAADADAHATDTKTYPPKKPPAGIQTKTKVAIEIDLLISNPPYISPSDFRNGTTARSVRLFEPRLALVPPVTIQDGRSPREPHKTRTEPRDSKCHSNGYPCARPHPNSPPHLNPEDIFYRRILHLSQKVKAGITVLECGDRMQAERVVRMFRRMNAMGMDMDVDMSEGSSSPSSSTSLSNSENNSPSHEVENQQPDEREPFTVEIWPSTDDDLRANGFHPTDGSRCVIIQRK